MVRCDEAAALRHLRVVAGLDDELLYVGPEVACAGADLVVAREERRGPELPGARVDHEQNAFVRVADEHLRGFERRRRLDAARDVAEAGERGSLRHARLARQPWPHVHHGVGGSKTSKHCNDRQGSTSKHVAPP